MESITTRTIPQPRTPRIAAAPSTYEQGCSGTDLVHAARKTLQGHKALCDGSPIVEFASGRFDIAAPAVCRACAAAAAPTG